jgi:hypothetical protein
MYLPGNAGEDALTGTRRKPRFFGAAFPVLLQH